MKKYINKYLFFTLGLFFAISCGDLDEELKDTIDPDNFFNTEAEYRAALASSYNRLNEFTFWFPLVLENYSDNLTIFTHTSGWNNARHRRTDTHELSPNDNLAFPLGTIWNPIFDGIAQTNATIQALEDADDSSPFKADFLAQAKVIRAYIYFLGMDIYGGMPLVTTAALPLNQPLPSRSSTQKVFIFI